jgi:hypothetical protein
MVWPWVSVAGGRENGATGKSDHGETGCRGTAMFFAQHDFFRGFEQNPGLTEAVGRVFRKIAWQKVLLAFCSGNVSDKGCLTRDSCTFGIKNPGQTGGIERGRGFG